MLEKPVLVSVWQSCSLSQIYLRPELSIWYARCGEVVPFGRKISENIPIVRSYPVKTTQNRRFSPFSTVTASSSHKIAFFFVRDLAQARLKTSLTCRQDVIIFWNLVGRSLIEWTTRTRNLSRFHFDVYVLWAKEWIFRDGQKRELHHAFFGVIGLQRDTVILVPLNSDIMCIVRLSCVVYKLKRIRRSFW